MGVDPEAYLCWVLPKLAEGTNRSTATGHTRRVLGWALGSILDVAMAIAALRMAVQRRRPAPGLIVHSDRGAQFTSHAYRQALAAHGLVASMSRKGNCYDKAFIYPRAVVHIGRF